MASLKKNPTPEQIEKFKQLTTKPLEDQTEFFLKSFIFALDDKWKVVIELQKAFRKYLRDANEGKDDLNPIQAADFLQKNGLERTAVQRKEELADIDYDKNDRICFMEYLLLHFKKMILEEYYKRTGEKMNEDLNKNGIGVTGVGYKILDELFTMPLGLSPELERAIEEFSQKKKSREAKLNELRQKTALGGVKGKAAENEAKQMENEDLTEMNKMELTLEAAKKKASKGSAEQALKEKQKKEEEEKKKKEQESKAKLKGMAAKFEQQNS